MSRIAKRELEILSETLHSLSLSDVRHALADITPPYPRRLLNALREDTRVGASHVLEELRGRQRADLRVKRRIKKMLLHETQARADGYQVIAGVDEVGRGPLAGPVVAAAAIFPNDAEPPPEINDSKLLTDPQRRKVFSVITAMADIGVGVVSVEEIDRINIHKANLLAMRLAIEDLQTTPDLILIDGRHKVVLQIPQRTIIKGDKLSISIAAASIVAKVVRDEMMLEFDKKYPQYKFAQHKGYATEEHIALLREFGISPIHRRSFAPVKELVEPRLL